MYFKTLKNQPRKNAKTIVFDLHQHSLGAYYYGLIYFFEQNGYNVILKNNFWFIANCIWKDRSQLIFNHSTVKIKSLISKKTEKIYFFDNPTNNERQYYQKSVQIDWNIFSPHQSPSVVMPFPMHPMVYELNKNQDLKALSTKTRKIRLYFAGNLTPKIYKTPIITDFFKILNRVEIIQTLLTELKESEKLIIRQPSDYEEIEKSYQLKFVMRHWYDELAKNLEISVKKDAWLIFLSKCDFFLACPGIQMPFSHNVIEGMAVGVIPFIQRGYAELFYPPLSHLHNAIIFENQSDLVEKTRLILQMPDDEVVQLRENALIYYDSHLSPQSFCNKIESFPEAQLRMYLYATDMSYQAYLKTAKLKA
jgi:hypothetical protein